MKKVYIVGGGGFARECHALLQCFCAQNSEYSFAGFLGHNGNIMDCKTLQEFFIGDVSAHKFTQNELVVIGVGNTTIRRLIYDDVCRQGGEHMNLIAPTSNIGDTTILGTGNIISHNCRMVADITIGNGNLFNGDIIIGHDSVIGDFNFFAPRSMALGNVTIGNGNLIGANSVLLPNCKIGDANKIAPLSAVYKGCKNKCYMLGNPAMKVGALDSKNGD